MAFRDKLRALMFGIPAGIPSHDLNGEKILFLRDIPLEFDEALPRWLLAHPELVQSDSPECVVRFDQTNRIAITWEAWESYLRWIQQTLYEAANAALEGLESEK